jgi:hypothetical protein
MVKLMYRPFIAVSIVELFPWDTRLALVENIGVDFRIVVINQVGWTWISHGPG